MLALRQSILICYAQKHLARSVDPTVNGIGRASKGIYYIHISLIDNNKIYSKKITQKITKLYANFFP